MAKELPGTLYVLGSARAAEALVEARQMVDHEVEDTPWLSWPREVAGLLQEASVGLTVITDVQPIEPGPRERPSLDPGRARWLGLALVGLAAAAGLGIGLWIGAS